MLCRNCGGLGCTPGPVTKDSLQFAAERISRMGFSSSDPKAQADIVQELAMMAESDQQVVWFGQVFPRAYKDWPGLKEMRAFFSRAYTPRDGIEAESAVFDYESGGIPRKLLGNPPGKSRLAPALEAPRILQLRGGDTSESPNLNQMVSGVSDRMVSLPTPTKEDIKASRQIFGHESESTWERQQSEWFERLPKVPAGMQKSEWLRRLEWDFGLGNLEQREAILKKLSRELKPSDPKPGPITEADFEALRLGKK